MKKSFWNFWKSGAAVILVYIPLLLLWIEFRKIPFLEMTWWRYALSFILLWGGFILAGWAYYLLVKEGEGNPLEMIPTSKLVKSGPYKYVRNPLCTGAAAVLLGEAGYFGSWYVLAWAILFIAAMYVYVVRVEEYKLANKFGKEYITYKMDTGRFFPRRLW